MSSAQAVRRRPDEQGTASLWLANHPLGGFFVLAFGISWSLWLVGFAAGGAGALLLILGAFGPMAAAALVTRAGGGSVRGWLRGISAVRVPWRYYAFAAGLPVAVYGLVNLILVGLGRNVEPTLLSDRLLPYLVTVVGVAVLGGGQEEPGWRGFALPKLQETKTPIQATLILGLLWGLWHVPLYGPLGFAVPLLLAPFYSYLFNRTGSVIPCLLLHGSFTAAQEHLTLLATETHGVTDAAIGISYLAGGLAMLLLTRGRLGKSEREAEEGALLRRARPATI